MVGDVAVLTNMAPALTQTVGTPPKESAPRSDSYSGQHLATAIRSFSTAIASGRLLCILIMLMNTVYGFRESCRRCRVQTCSLSVHMLQRVGLVQQRLSSFEKARGRASSRHPRQGFRSIDSYGARYDDASSGCIPDKEPTTCRDHRIKNTSRNAPLVAECIRMLYTKELLFHESNLKQWAWKEEDVRLALDNTCEQSIRVWSKLRRNKRNVEGRFVPWIATGRGSIVTSHVSTRYATFSRMREA